jgi:hypothetical protein
MKKADVCIHEKKRKEKKEEKIREKRTENRR